MSHTLVTFHAHPDDEALLTSGTMAKAAAAGHRVVLVTATDGGLGLAAGEYRDDGGLGARRLAELRRSADALGVARVVHLGYADSGMEGQAPDNGFVTASADEAAGRLAEVLDEEDADVLTSYDPGGGYGHRDHVRVHEVGALAAEMAGTKRVLEATVPRDLLVGAVKAVSKVYTFPDAFDIEVYERAFTARKNITHRIDVHRHIAAKRAAMAAHASQATADDGDRTLAAFLRIPRPVYDLVFGREWFVDPAHEGPVARDVFAGLA